MLRVCRTTVHIYAVLQSTHPTPPAPNSPGLLHVCIYTLADAAIVEQIFLTFIPLLNQEKHKRHQFFDRLKCTRRTVQSDNSDHTNHPPSSSRSFKVDVFPIMPDLAHVARRVGPVSNPHDLQ